MKTRTQKRMFLTVLAMILLVSLIGTGCQPTASTPAATAGSTVATTVKPGTTASAAGTVSTTKPGTTGTATTAAQTSAGTTGAPTQPPSTMTTLKVLAASDNVNLHYNDTKNSKTWPIYLGYLEKINIKLDYEVIDWEQFPTVLSTRIASGTAMPDLLFVGTLEAPTRISMIERKTVLPLDDIMKLGDQSGKPGTALQALSKTGDYNFIRALNTYSDGKMYFLDGAAINSGMNIGPVGLFDSYALQIRVDWLEKLNLKMPDSLDSFVSTMKAFQDNDVNGSGVKGDERVVVATNDFNNGIAQWFGLGPYEYSVDLANRKLVTPFDQKGFPDYIAFMQRLIKDKFLDITDYKNLTALNAGNNVAALRNVSAHPSYAKATSDKNAYMAYIPNFTAVPGINPAMTYQVSKMAYNLRWCFTSTAKDKMAAAARLLDFFFSKQHYEYYQYGVEGMTFKYDDDGVQVQTARLENTKEQLREKGLGWGQWYGTNILPRMADSLMWQAGKDGTNQGIFNTLAEMKASKFFAKRNVVYDNLGAKGLWAKNIEQNMSPKSDYYDSNNNVGSYCAMPTKAELDVLAKYTDLKTRTTEILENLITGRYSMNDWSKYRKELTDLGFDEVFKVYDAQCKRYFDTLK